LPVHRGLGFKMAGMGSLMVGPSGAPGLLGPVALYTSCMNSSLSTKVSRFVSSTPATTWSCNDRVSDESHADLAEYKSMGVWAFSGVLEPGGGRGHA